MSRIALLTQTNKKENPLITEAFSSLPEQIDAKLFTFDQKAELGDLLRQIKDQGFERVLVCGGDGSLNCVVDAMLKLDVNSRLALGILPLGTANDFAQTAGFAAEGFVPSVLLTAQAPLRKIDVGCVNGQPFINVATGGAVAETTTSVSAQLKSYLGKFAYYLNGLVKAVNIETVGLSIEGDGFNFKQRCVAFAVGNSSSAGGGFQVAPEAKIDDGNLDLMVIPEQGLGELVNLAAVFMQEDPDLTDRNVLYKKTKAFCITADQDIQVNLDGEPMTGRVFDFKVIPRALDFAVSDAVTKEALLSPIIEDAVRAKMPNGASTETRR